MKDQNYIISHDSTYIEIRRSGLFDRGLRIEYMSDQPSEEDIKQFIATAYPELNKEILFIHFDTEWVSEWNLGNQKGCFGLIFVFFKQES